MQLTVLNLALVWGFITSEWLVLGSSGWYLPVLSAVKSAVSC